MARTHSRQSGESVVVWLLLTAGINVVALLFIDWVFDSVRIEGFWSYFLGALALTVGNAIINPILALLTLPLIIFSFGLAYFAINVAMLALAEWVAPKFAIDGLFMRPSTLSQSANPPRATSSSVGSQVIGRPPGRR